MIVVRGIGMHSCAVVWCQWRIEQIPFTSSSVWLLWLQRIYLDHRNSKGRSFSDTEPKSASPEAHFWQTFKTKSRIFNVSLQISFSERLKAEENWPVSCTFLWIMHECIFWCSFYQTDNTSHLRLQRFCVWCCPTSSHLPNCPFTVDLIY